MRPWPVWFGLAVLMLMAATALASPTSSHAITIVVNGETQHFDSPPVVIEGLVLVPLRGVFEKLGASVVWVGNGGTIRIEGGPVVHLKLGSREASVGDRLVKLEAEPRYYGHRIYVPLRFVTEALGGRGAYPGALGCERSTSPPPSPASRVFSGNPRRRLEARSRPPLRRPCRLRRISPGRISRTRRPQGRHFDRRRCARVACLSK